MGRTGRKRYFYRIFFMIFTAGIVLAIFMAGITSGAFYGMYQKEVRSQSLDSVEKMCLAMENDVENYRGILLGLSENPSVKLFLEGKENQERLLLQNLYMLRNSIGRKAVLSAVRLSDRCWLSTTEQVMEQSLAEFENWGVFRKANDTQDVAVYAMAKDALLSAEDRFCMAKACRNSTGEVLGYLLMEVPRSTLDDIVKKHSDQYSTSTLVFNKTGSIIYHSEGTAQEGLGKGEAYGVQGFFKQNKGILEKKYAFCQSDALGLMFLKEIPADIVPVLMKTISSALIPAILVIMILAFVFARILAKSISDPIREMIGTMGEIKKGDLSKRVNFRRDDELGELGRAFDSMTARVETLMKRVDEEKRSLWIAETRSLSLQMTPHFLYNTLDLIKWNAKLGKNQEIVDITVLLGRVLRRIMNTESDLVTVAYELEIVSAFVGIQKKHYGERLCMETDVAPEMMEMKIPKLVIQPIVENAIVHGFGECTEDCRIQITGCCEGKRMIFVVKDNGRGMSEDEVAHMMEARPDGSHHIGLYNVQRRARLFGDESCGLAVSSVSGKGTVVTLTLKGADR